MRIRTLAAFVVMMGLAGGMAVLAQKPGRSTRPSAAPAENPPPPVEVVSPPPIAPAEPPAVPDGAASPPLLPAETAAVPDGGVSPPVSELQVDDPMADVDQFVEQNRKKAKDSIERLSKEAETLRARLRKVETALERWKSLAGALDQPPGGELAPALVESRPKSFPGATGAELPPAAEEPTPAPRESRRTAPSDYQLPPPASPK